MITLRLNGQKITYSKEELTAILEEYYGENNSELLKKFGVSPLMPKEEEWFEVDPLNIDQTIFESARKDMRQENMRQLILEAFVELKNNPERYGKKFKTIMPKKTWDFQNMQGFNILVNEIGDHMADWVEQALQWAQIIKNGNSWKDVCNRPDTANWYRLVVWKDGRVKFVGGSKMDDNPYPPSDVGGIYCFPESPIKDSIPLVVSYNK